MVERSVGQIKVVDPALRVLCFAFVREDDVGLMVDLANYPPNPRPSGGPVNEARAMFIHAFSKPMKRRMRSWLPVRTACGEASS